VEKPPKYITRLWYLLISRYGVASRNAGVLVFSNLMEIYIIMTSFSFLVFSPNFQRTLVPPSCDLKTVASCLRHSGCRGRLSLTFSIANMLFMDISTPKMIPISIIQLHSAITQELGVVMFYIFLGIETV
jgi:hypothetical protein